jgi:ABC-type Zn uptake system ZnuABC Zn-binding protein ZnuA
MCKYFVLMALLLLAACQSNQSAEEATAVFATMPTIEPANVDGRLLRVVATTSIVGDVVAQVGGANIELTTLMQPGQDPHSYTMSPGDMVALTHADLIFVHGWNLEESLLGDIAAVAQEQGIPVVPVAAGVTPLLGGVHGHEEEEAHEEEADGVADPHTWMAVPNVQIWVENIAAALTARQPEMAAGVAERTAVYQQALQQLDGRIRTETAVLSDADRILVTNHDALGYFADAYGFTIVGTVIPGLSTLAEPSANDLAALTTTMAESGVCIVYSETTANNTLAQTVAAELTNCPTVKVLPLHTGALGAPGSGADSYMGMMEQNLATIMGSVR